MLMVSVAMVMMPAQTNGLNQLPPYRIPRCGDRQHPDAGFRRHRNRLVRHHYDVGAAALYGRTSGAADETAALAAGVKQAFTFGFLLAVLALSLALFVKRVKVAPKPEKGGQEKKGSFQKEPGWLKPAPSPNCRRDAGIPIGWGSCGISPVFLLFTFQNDDICQGRRSPWTRR